MLTRIETRTPAWRVNWSEVGTILAVSCGEQEEVRLFKGSQVTEKKWEQIQ
jgi:hypothetical protein